jgi:hypothetical protein
MKTKKQTSDRVSKYAAKVLAALADYGPGDVVHIRVTRLKMLAASCLGQDEHRGLRRRVRKPKART